MVRTRSKREYKVDDVENGETIEVRSEAEDSNDNEIGPNAQKENSDTSVKETQISIKIPEIDNNENSTEETLSIIDNLPSSSHSDLSGVSKDKELNNSSRSKIKKHRFYFPPPKSLVPEYIQHTSINVGMEITESYIDVKGVISGKKRSKKLHEKTISSKDSQLKDSVITPDFESKHAVPAEKSYRQGKKERKAERESTAGTQWYNFKPPEMTEEIKRDLKILQMRSVLDPKRFYKQNDRRTLPKYFQIGKIKGDATDFYSSRMPKKQRKATLTEELLADAEFRRYQKRKYNEIQMKQKEMGSWKRFRKNKKFPSKKSKNNS